MYYHAVTPQVSQVATMIITAILDPTLPLDNTYVLNGIWGCQLTYPKLIGPRFGATYIAVLFATVIYGVCLVQSFNYFQSELPFFMG